LLGFIV